MKPETKPLMNTNTRKLHDLRQRFWLDNITREMLDNGTLAQIARRLREWVDVFEAGRLPHPAGTG